MEAKDIFSSPHGKGARLQVVPPSVDRGTVEFLEDLLEMARRGELIGVAAVAMLKKREFITNATGETSRNPVFARGMLRVLDDQLADRIHGHGN